MKKVLYIILSLSCQVGLCQKVWPQVLNSAGSAQILGNGATITDNVGEPFTTTIGNGTTALLTQGFIQPTTISTNKFDLTAFVTDVYCNGKNDGRISTALTTTAFNYSVAYYWLPASLCPAHNCSSIDSLKAGSYSLTVVFTYTTLANTVTQETVVIAPAPSTSTSPGFQLNVQDVNGPCMLKVFTGITLNNDGKNDYLFIENVSEFPNNSITIFNRWGKQMYQEKGYDNVTKFWPTADEADKLVPSTYFYVLDPGDGSKVVKGWIEIIKN